MAHVYARGLMSEMHFFAHYKSPCMKKIVSHILQHVHMIVPDVRTVYGREDIQSDLTHLDMARLDCHDIHKGELNAHFFGDILCQMRYLVMYVL